MIKKDDYIQEYLYIEDAERLPEPKPQKYLHEPEIERGVFTIELF